MPTAKPTAAGTLSLCARDDGSKMAVVSVSLTFGATRDEDDEEGGKKDELPLEVSGFAMLALLASVGGVLFLALRRGA